MTEQTEPAGPEVVEDKPGTAIVVETKVEGLKDLAEQLAKLHQRMYNVVWDCKTTAGDKQARRDRKDLVSTRTALTSRAAELKRNLRASVATQIEEIDTDAEKMVQFVKRYEDPLDALIEADEARRAAEKKARDDAEAERTAELRERVAEISSVAARAIGLKSAELKTKMDMVTRLPIGEDFQEFRSSAVNAKAECLLALQELFDKAVETEAKEAEAARNAERLATLERENAEREAREKTEREERTARENKERTERETREAEERRVERARQAQIESAARMVTAIAKITKLAQAMPAASLLHMAQTLDALTLDLDKQDFGASHDGVATELQAAIAEVHDLHAKAVVREEDDRRLLALAEKASIARQEIDAIRHQFLIAQVGRVPYTRPRNIDDLKVLIGDTERWPITAEKFGDQLGAAEDARDATVAKLKKLLAELEAEHEALKDEVVVVDTPSKSVVIGMDLADADDEIVGTHSEVLIPDSVAENTPDDLALQNMTPADAEIQVPVLVNFGDTQPIGYMILRRDALPPTPDFVFSIGFMALDPHDAAPGTVPRSQYLGAYDLRGVALQTDGGYIAYQQQIGRLPTNEHIAALEAVVHAVVDVMKAATPSKVRKEAAGPWIVPLPEMNELKLRLRAVPLPGGQYYAEDGTFMNADGTRNIFDDVAE